jgi:hypothetical protein
MTCGYLARQVASVMRMQAAVRRSVAERLASILHVEQHMTHVAARPSQHWPILDSS